MNRRSKKIVEQEKEYQELIDNKPILKGTGIKFKSKNPKQKELAKSIKAKEITICSGPAGTGKTFVACAMALKMLRDSAKYKRIVLIKSVTTLKNEELGFLKGTLEEKMEPFVYSYIHNFEKLIPKSIVRKLKGEDMIQIMPLAYVRGINFDDCMLGDSSILLSNGTYINIKDLFDKFSSDLNYTASIKSYNFDKETVEIDTLDSISRNPIYESVYEIKTEDGRVLNLTENHKLFVKGEGYKKIKHISDEDILLNI